MRASALALAWFHATCCPAYPHAQASPVTCAQAEAAQVSISGQALVFVVRTEGYSLFSRAGLWTYIAFAVAQVWPAVAAPQFGSSGSLQELLMTSRVFRTNLLLWSPAHSEHLG